MIKILSTVAVLSLMASPAFADCPNSKSGFTYQNTTTSTDTDTDTSSQPVSQTYQGYSKQPQRSPGGQGTSTLSGDLVTTTTTTTNTSQDNYSKTTKGTTTTTSCNENSTSSTETSRDLENITASGPGNSPAEDRLGDRTGDLLD